jgi:hypothetical protein
VTLRRAATLAALTFLVGTSLDPVLLTLPFRDREAYARELALLPDHQWPQYPRFLEEVRVRTKPGDRIALVFPVMRWDDGYSYAYYRASYFLTGREVLPLVDEHDHPQPQNLAAARYIATWRGSGGTLARRR